MNSEKEKREVILVTGACGQIGIDLVDALREQFGKERVIATDIKPATDCLLAKGPYYQLDVLDKTELEKLVRGMRVTQVYHLAAVLSANGEQNPLAGWHLNMQSLLNVLEAAKDNNLRVFWPSSIAVFGSDARKHYCPQDSVCNPETAYGISKSAGEQWCAYYKQQYGLDIRSIRYPGLISHSAQPGGGTTDYAVAIFHEAISNNSYKCYLHPDTYLPMMYMPDAIRATLELMAANKEDLTVSTSYNLAGISFTPADIANEIGLYLTDFEIDYEPDGRQKIADSWPASINDKLARRDWNWHPEYDLSSMTIDMLQHVQYHFENNIQMQEINS